MRHEQSNQYTPTASRPLSNAAERNRALRFATMLSLVLMALAAGGGYLFSFSQYLTAKDNASNKTQMENYLGEQQKMAARLADLSEKYHRIDSLDGLWVKSAPLSPERSGLQNLIRPLEDDLSLKVGRFRQENTGDIAQLAASAYYQVLSLRGMLWALRDAKAPQTPPVDAAMLLQQIKSGNDLDACKKNARTIAGEIDDKAADLDTVIKKIRGLGDRQDKIDLERLVKEFENIARKLRDTP